MIQENLKLIRKFAGISQRELGRRIDMSGQYIAKIEKGERTPTIETLKNISEKLNIELFELLERPKFSRELFFDVLSEKQISYEQLSRDCEMDEVNISSTLCEAPLSLLENYYKIGTYLGFSKGYLEKRRELDTSIHKLISNDDYKKYKDSLLKNYSMWNISSTLKINQNEYTTATILSNTYFDSIMKWSENSAFNSFESICIREHFFDLLLRYKLLIESLSSAKRTWIIEKDSFIQIYKKRKDPLSDEEIEELFFKQELQKEINDLINWINSFPNWIKRREIELSENSNQSNDK